MCMTIARSHRDTGIWINQSHIAPGPGDYSFTESTTHPNAKYLFHQKCGLFKSNQTY